MKTIIAILLGLLLTGCAADPYGLYTEAYTTHITQDTRRIIDQSDSITLLVEGFQGTLTEQALMRAFGVIAISQLTPTPFMLQKPTQWEDVGMSLANQATAVVGISWMGVLGKWGLENSGTEFQGDAFLENSFNRQHSTALWSGQSSITGMAPAPPPLVVRPEIVRP